MRSKRAVPATSGWRLSNSTYTVEMVTPDVESTNDSPPLEKGPVVAEPTAVFLQATLAPGESEKCNVTPCVPRYQTEFVPPEDELPLPEFEIYFPVNPRLGPLQLQFTNRRDLDLSVRRSGQACTPGGVNQTAGEGKTTR